MTLQELLLESGRIGLTIPRLVARANIAQGTIYNYFDSLAAAIDAVSELPLAEHYRTMLRVIRDTEDAAEVIARSGLQTLMVFDRRPDVGKLVFDTGLPLDRIMLMRGFRNQLLANLQWGAETEVFSPGSQQAACSVHMGAMAGASLDIHRGRLSVDEAPDIVARLLRDLGVERRRAERLAHRPQEFEPWCPLPLVPEPIPLAFQEMENRPYDLCRIRSSHAWRGPRRGARHRGGPRRGGDGGIAAR